MSIDSFDWCWSVCSNADPTWASGYDHTPSEINYSAGDVEIRDPDLSCDRAPVGRDTDVYVAELSYSDAATTATTTISRCHPTTNANIQNNFDASQGIAIPRIKMDFNEGDNPEPAGFNDAQNYYEERSDVPQPEEKSQFEQEWERAAQIHEAADQCKRDAQQHVDNAASAAKDWRVFEALDEATEAAKDLAEAASLDSKANHVEWEAAKDAAANGSAGGCVIC